MRCDLASTHVAEAVMRSAIFLFMLGFGMASAQVPDVPGTVPSSTPPAGYKIIAPKENPTVGPGELLLIELEGKFAKAVAESGGKAFSDWFAGDAVMLNNGKPVVVGLAAIMRDANWSPKDYSLTWTPQGAQMGPSNDMGFTWGHYVAKSVGLDGKPVVMTGRYITVWKKQADGKWKVAMDAGADEPAAMECCTVKQP
jgi:ketosteroid isomerase-like protein